MKKDYVNVNNLKVSNTLLKFVNEEVLKDTNITAEKFWLGFDKSVHELAPKNRELLKKRKDYKIKSTNGIYRIKVKIFKLMNTKNFSKKLDI